jgi:hypothetical protein
VVVDDIGQRELGLQVVPALLHLFQTINNHGKASLAQVGLYL